MQLIHSISNAGTHASYCFPIEGIVKKLRSYSHFEEWKGKTDEQIADTVQAWIRENKSTGEPLEPERDPRTNPELLPYRLEVRQAMIKWTMQLHKQQLGET